MGTNNRTNSLFLNSYIELDKICAQKFGITSGGVTEYINRLINARFAPEREQVLPRLVRYRNIRNRIAHEAGALQNIDELTRSDVKWLEDFVKDIEKKRDPITLYLRKARKYAKRRRTRKRIVGFFVLLLIAAAVAGFFVFKDNIMEIINNITKAVSGS